MSNEVLDVYKRMSDDFAGRIEELHRENRKLTIENRELKALAKDLAIGWDQERVNDFGGELAFGEENNWHHWDMVKDERVRRLFE